MRISILMKPTYVVHFCLQWYRPVNLVHFRVTGIFAWVDGLLSRCNWWLMRLNQLFTISKTVDKKQSHVWYLVASAFNLLLYDRPLWNGLVPHTNVRQHRCSYKTDITLRCGIIYAYLYINECHCKYFRCKRYIVSANNALSCKKSTYSSTYFF